MWAFAAKQPVAAANEKATATAAIGVLIMRAIPAEVP
jgi:hypothetical protein